MQRLERILAVFDPTAATQPAVAKAARLAAASKASLEILVCDYEPALANPRFFPSDRLRVLREEFLARHDSVLERHAAGFRNQGLTVTTEARWAAHPHQGIVERVRESAPYLVVKDTHYHGVIRRAVLTNTDWNLIRSCPAPLLLAKPGEWRTPARIMTGVDPGHEADPDATLDHELLLALVRGFGPSGGARGGRPRDARQWEIAEVIVPIHADEIPPTHVLWLFLHPHNLLAGERL